METKKPVNTQFYIYLPDDKRNLPGSQKRKLTYSSIVGFFLSTAALEKRDIKYYLPIYCFLVLWAFINLSIKKN